MGHELKLKWIPNGNEKLSGEVKGDVIYVYDEDEQEALETLRHEFLDYILTKELIWPSQELINKLISLFGELLYERKEKLIEKILKAV